MSANTEAVGGGALERAAEPAVAPVKFDSLARGSVETSQMRSDGREKIRLYAGRVGIASFMILAGAVNGAISGGSDKVETSIGPGLSFTTQLHTSEQPQADVSFGSLFALHSKGMAYNLPLASNTNIAPYIEFQEIDMKNPSLQSIDSLKAAVSDITQIGESIKGEIIHNTATQGATGGGLGLAGSLLGLGAYYRLEERKKRQKQRDQEYLQLHSALGKHIRLSEDYADNLPKPLAEAHKESKSVLGAITCNPENNGAHRKHHREKFRRYIGGVVAAAAILGGTALHAEHAFSAVNYEAPASARHLSPDIIEMAPESSRADLKNITVSGIGAWGVNNLAEIIAGEKQDTDKYWQDINHRTTEEFAELRKQGELPWETDPGKVTVLAVSDIHGNMSFLNNALPGILQATRANVMANTGDQENTGGSFMLDEESLQAMVKSVDPNQLGGRQVPIVFVSGNHDSAKLPKSILKTTYVDSDNNKYHPLIPLTKDNGYKTNIDGLNFVGGPDLNETTTGSTIPANPADQQANSAKLGQTVTDVACQIQAESGTSSIVMTHEPAAGYQALAEGCSSVALSGHLHSVHKLHGFALPNGNSAYLENLGSASGDGPNNPTAVYNKATTPGNAILNVFDKYTGQLTNFVTITYTPGGEVTVKAHKASSTSNNRFPADSPKVNQFLSQFNLKSRALTDPTDTQDVMMIHRTRLQPVTHD